MQPSTVKIGVFTITLDRVGALEIRRGEDYALPDRDFHALAIAAADAIEKARAVVQANHEWHITYDEYGGYPESDLCEQNMAAGAIDPPKPIDVDDNDNVPAPTEDSSVTDHFGEVNNMVTPLTPADPARGRGDEMEADQLDRAAPAGGEVAQ